MIPESNEKLTTMESTSRDLTMYVPHAPRRRSLEVGCSYDHTHIYGHFLLDAREQMNSAVPGHAVSTARTCTESGASYT